MPDLKGNRRPDDWRRAIFRSRVSAVRNLVRVFRYGCGSLPEPEPGAEDLNLGPDGRDLRPENEQALALALSLSVINSVLCHRLSHRALNSASLPPLRP